MRRVSPDAIDCIKVPGNASASAPMGQVLSLPGDAPKQDSAIKMARGGVPWKLATCEVKLHE